MADSNFPSDVLEVERIEGRLITRRFTDDLTGSNTLERLTKAAQAESDEEQEIENESRVRLLYEGPEKSSTAYVGTQIVDLDPEC
jgi:hypothetical protein